MPPEVSAFLEVFVEFSTASSVAAREIAWNKAVEFLVKNPRIYAYLGSTLRQDLVLAVERQLLAIFARKGIQRGVQATAGSGLRLWLARLGMNLAVAPKVPMPPQAQLALTLAIALATVAPAVAESRSMQKHGPAYESYLIEYFGRIAKILEAKPHLKSRLAPPLTFPDWYEINK